MITQWVARTGRLAVRPLAAAGLAVDAYVHADLAPVYDGVRGSISQGGLFRIEAGVAAAAALVVLVARRRAGLGVALAVAGSALGVLLFYRYVDPGRIGPLPDMYEPAWFPEKMAAAVAEGAATVLAACGLLWEVWRPQPAGSGGRRLAPILGGGLLCGLAVAAVAGFAGGGTGAPAGPPVRVTAGTQEVTITGNNSLRFVPMRVHLHPGTVRITLRDSGAYPHNIVIPALHVTSPTVSGVPGGVQASFTVTFPHPGSYAFHCQYHAGAGMTGTFVVS